MQEVMSLELAEKEVTAWLDRKKIPVSKRERANVAIENIIEKVQFGEASIDSNGAIAYTLTFPLQDANGSTTLDTLNFKPRVNTESVMKITSMAKVQIPETTLLATIADLTGQPYGMITKLDPVDQNICKSIGIFFMS